MNKNRKKVVQKWCEKPNKQWLVGMHNHAMLNYLNVLLGRLEYKFIPTKSARMKVVSVNQFIKMQVPLLKKQNDRRKKQRQFFIIFYNTLVQ